MINHKKLIQSISHQCKSLLIQVWEILRVLGNTLRQPDQFSIYSTETTELLLTIKYPHHLSISPFLFQRKISFNPCKYINCLSWTICSLTFYGLFVTCWPPHCQNIFASMPRFQAFCIFFVRPRDFCLIFGKSPPNKFKQFLPFWGQVLLWIECLSFTP